MTKDIEAAARLKKCPSANVITRMFGSLRDALAAAKLPPNTMQQFSEQEMIAQLRDLSLSLGRPLMRRDVVSAGANGTCARAATFDRVFGSISDAFRKAGVQRLDRYSKNDLIAQYRALSKEVGRPAWVSHIQRAAANGQGPGYHIYKRVFGGLTETRRLAGLLRGAAQRYTRQELMDQLKALALELGRAPTADDVRRAAARGEMAGLKTFRVYFGGHNKALKEAGLDVNKPTGFSRGGLILDLRQLAEKLGRRPSHTDVDRASQAGLCACAATYCHYFGSFTRALKAARLDGMAGIAPTVWRDGQPIRYSKAEIVERLRDLGRELGRAPTYSDVVDASSRAGLPKRLHHNWKLRAVEHRS
jgi:hypothetical protein